MRKGKINKFVTTFIAIAGIGIASAEAGSKNSKKENTQTTKAGVSIVTGSLSSSPQPDQNFSTKKYNLQTSLLSDFNTNFAIGTIRGEYNNLSTGDVHWKSKNGYSEEFILGSKDYGKKSHASVVYSIGKGLERFVLAGDCNVEKGTTRLGAFFMMDIPLSKRWTMSLAAGPEDKYSPGKNHDPNTIGGSVFLTLGGKF